MTHLWLYSMRARVLTNIYLFSFLFQNFFIIYIILCLISINYFNISLIILYSLSIYLSLSIFLSIFRITYFSSLIFFCLISYIRLTNYLKISIFLCKVRIIYFLFFHFLSLSLSLLHMFIYKLHLFSFLS